MKMDHTRVPFMNIEDVRDEMQRLLDAGVDPKSLVVIDKSDDRHAEISYVKSICEYVSSFMPNRKFYIFK